MKTLPEENGHGREGKSSQYLDYVLMSQELADSTSGMTVDDDGCFDIGSDHNLINTKNYWK